MAGLFLQACQGLGDGIGHVHLSTTPVTQALKPQDLPSARQAAHFKREALSIGKGARGVLVRGGPFAMGARGLAVEHGYIIKGIAPSLMEGSCFAMEGSLIYVCRNFFHAQRPGNGAGFGVKVSPKLLPAWKK